MKKLLISISHFCSPDTHFKLRKWCPLETINNIIRHFDVQASSSHLHTLLKPTQKGLKLQFLKWPQKQQKKLSLSLLTFNLISYYVCHGGILKMKSEGKRENKLQGRNNMETLLII